MTVISLDTENHFIVMAKSPQTLFSDFVEIDENADQKISQKIYQLSELVLNEKLQNQERNMKLRSSFSIY